jgi:hypothetical protein
MQKVYPILFVIILFKDQNKEFFMLLKTFNYQKSQGWSIENFPKELDSENTLVLAFCAPEFIDDFTPIQELARSFPKSTLTGCSSSGEIFGAEINDHSISVAVLKLERSQLRIAFSKVNDIQDSYQIGKELFSKLNATDLKSILILSEGLKVNGSELVKGFNVDLSENVIVTGGLSGDGDKFKKTWIIYEGKPETELVAAIGFYGDNIKIGHGSKGGWDSFGPERRVTRSQGNILYALDGKPALALYKEYLGERAKGLPATGLLFPLVIRENQQDTKQIVRTILGVNELDQSLIFAGDIPTGYLAKLMKANFDRLITGANEAALLAGSFAFSKAPILSIAISCVGRRLVMGTRTEEETESTLQSLPKGTEQIGFYSYGEISPFNTGSCDLHNQTMTLTTIAED